MSTVTYTPAEISGTLAMPPSKSAAMTRARKAGCNARSAPRS